MHTGLDVIEKLIAYWGDDWNAHEADYLTVIIPGIVRSDDSVQLTKEEKKYTPLLQRLLSAFLGADKQVTIDPDVELLNPNEYNELKQRFVRDWVLRQNSQPLDPEQAATVVAIEGDVQVVARAGSGKTRTLTTRAIFLQKHCRVSPHALLLLAFNKKAAEEMICRSENDSFGTTIVNGNSLSSRQTIY